MLALAVAAVEVSAVAVAFVAAAGYFLAVVAGVGSVGAPAPVQALVLVVEVLAGLRPIRMDGNHFSLPVAEALRSL